MKSFVVKRNDDDGRKKKKKQNRRKCHTNNLWKTHHNLTNPKQL